MGGKPHVTDDKMHVTVRIDDPDWLAVEYKRMARALIRHEFRGPGDTIEAAAARAGRRHRVEPSFLLQGWNRPPRQTLVSRWMAVFRAYHAQFIAKAEKAYEDKRHEADDHCHPAILRLADLVSGHGDDASAAEPPVKDE